MLGSWEHLHPCSVSWELIKVALLLRAHTPVLCLLRAFKACSALESTYNIHPCSVSWELIHLCSILPSIPFLSCCNIQTSDWAWVSHNLFLSLKIWLLKESLHCAGLHWCSGPVHLKYNCTIFVFVSTKCH